MPVSPLDTSSERPLADPGVPLVDLRPQHAPLADDLTRVVAEVVREGAFVLGRQVREFEELFAEFCGVRHCIGVANGTDAVELALRAAGVPPGAEVIVPANTFVATAEAVVRAGARPVFADCGPDYLLDPASAARCRTPRTAAAVGVDLYGQVAAFELLADALGEEVALVEDAAQSQGATRHRRPAGSFGAAAATSFYPGKNLGALGDGGAVTTDDDDGAERVRMLRNHGGTRKYEHLLVGVNSRLDSLQAAVLTLKLERLPGWNDQRHEAARRYRALLDDLPGLSLPDVAEGNEHVWHLFVVEVEDRDAVLGRLAERGVGAGIHYPVPVHLLPAFAAWGHRPGDFPRAEAASARILSLPLFPGITEAQQERVADALRDALRRRPR
jgi:dTDP-4-amino-4,6-dideoxygalactose transaminase